MFGRRHADQLEPKRGNRVEQALQLRLVSYHPDDRRRASGDLESVGIEHRREPRAKLTLHHHAVLTRLHAGALWVSATSAASSTAPGRRA